MHGSPHMTSLANVRVATHVQQARLASVGRMAEDVDQGINLGLARRDGNVGLGGQALKMGSCARCNQCILCVPTEPGCNCCPDTTSPGDSW